MAGARWAPVIVLPLLPVGSDARAAGDESSSPRVVHVIDPTLPLAARFQTAGGLHRDPEVQGYGLISSCHPSTAVPTAGCCTLVDMTIEGDNDCLCNVAEDGAFALSSLSVHVMWNLYKTCGGRREAIPEDPSSCRHAPAPPPSPPSPPAPERRRPPVSLAEIIVIVIGATLLACGGVFIAAALLIKPSTDAVPPPPPRHVIVVIMTRESARLPTVLPPAIKV